jgi:hypothetical protein
LKTAIITYLLIPIVGLISITSVKTHAEHSILNSKQEYKNDSLIDLLTKNKWITCGRFDSINQYRNIQLINKDVLKGMSNCTGDWAAQAEWTFTKTGGNNKVVVEYKFGWEDPAEFRQITIQNWRWSCNSVTKVIYLYLDNENNYYNTKEELNKAKFSLLIKEITKNSLVLCPLKL